MKRIIGMVLTAALLTACGKGQNGDPKPSNQSYLAKNKKEIELKNGTLVPVSKEVVGFVNVDKIIGGSALGGYANKHSYSLLEVTNNTLHSHIKGDETTSMPTGGKAHYSGSAFGYNNAPNDENIKSNSLNSAISRGTSEFLVDFGKKEIKGVVRIDGEYIEKTEKDTGEKDGAGNAKIDIVSEKKGGIVEILTQGRINGNKIENGMTQTMGEFKKENLQDRNLANIRINNANKDNNVDFTGGFYGPNAKEFAGSIEYDNSKKNVVFNADVTNK